MKHLRFIVGLILGMLLTATGALSAPSAVLPEYVGVTSCPTFTAGNAYPVYFLVSTGALCNGTGSGGGGGGGAVTAVSGAFVDGSIVTIGTIGDSAWSGSGNGTLVATTKYAATSLASLASAVGTAAAGTAGTKSVLAGGIYNSSPITLTNGQQASIQFDANGYMLVNVKSATGVAQGSTTSGQTISPIGCRTLSAEPTDTTAQTNVPRCNIQGAVAVQVVGGAYGGHTFATVTAANSTNATNLKASAGTLYHVTAYTISATPAWVSFYNTAGTPTCGTSIVYQVLIPANSTSGAGAVDDIPSGLNFSTGIGYCITTGIAGTGNVAATSYVVNLAYR